MTGTRRQKSWCCWRTALLIAWLCAGCSDSNGASGVCPEGLADCGGYCRALATDFAHCGACGATCSASDQSCVDGQCVASCPVTVIESKAELIAELAEASWPEYQYDHEKFLRVSGTIEVLGSEIGDGSLFRPVVDPTLGITLSDDSVFGVDPDSGECCKGWYVRDVVAPQPAYARAKLSDVSFRVRREQHYVDDGGPQCGEDPASHCTMLFFDDSMACLMPWACCCADSAIDWRPIQLESLPEGCGGPITCDGYVGPNPSECYESYLAYLFAQNPHLHPACVDASGHVQVDAACSCEVGWDYQRTVAGTCDAKGMCAMSEHPREPSPDNCK